MLQKKKHKEAYDKAIAAIEDAEFKSYTQSTRR